MKPKLIEALESRIRHIPNFPKKGVGFKDIAPLLGDKEYFRAAINILAEEIFAEFPEKIDKIVAIEARGFLIASALAYHMRVGLEIVRKKGKLPFETVSAEYELEYGKETLEMHADAIKAGENVLVVDDVLATGGTARAAADLVEKLGGNVAGFVFLIELAFLNGRKKLNHPRVFSLLVYDN